MIKGWGVQVVSLLLSLAIVVLSFPPATQAVFISGSEVQTIMPSWGGQWNFTATPTNGSAGQMTFTWNEPSRYVPVLIHYASPHYQIQVAAKTSADRYSNFADFCNAGGEVWQTITAMQGTDYSPQPSTNNSVIRKKVFPNTRAEDTRTGGMYFRLVFTVTPRDTLDFHQAVSPTDFNPTHQLIGRFQGRSAAYIVGCDNTLVQNIGSANQSQETVHQVTVSAELQNSPSEPVSVESLPIPFTVKTSPGNTDVSNQIAGYDDGNTPKTLRMDQAVLGKDANGVNRGFQIVANYSGQTFQHSYKNDTHQNVNIIFYSDDSPPSFNNTPKDTPGVLTPDQAADQAASAAGQGENCAKYLGISFTNDPLAGFNIPGYIGCVFRNWDLVLIKYEVYLISHVGM